jgi:[acyl-carrier-protein] S-malonyltransferase
VEASGHFRKDLESARFGPFERPVIPNCDPEVFYSRENAAELLRRQIISPVRWQETIEKMDEMGVETIVEVGPKRVLSGLIRNIRKDMRLVFVGDAESLGRCGELLCAA